MLEMKKIFIIGILLLFIITGCNKTPTSQVNNQKVETNHSIEVFGTIRALDAKNIMIDFPATIENICVREGQRVKKGLPLVTLNINQFKAEIKKKETELNVARLELSKTDNDAALKKLLNDLQYEENLYQKTQLLYEAGAISKYQLDDDSSSLEKLRKTVEELKIALNSLENERNNNMQIQQEKISSLEYELKMLRDKLDKSYLQDNVIANDTENGVVYDINYLPGDVIDNEKKVLSIINSDSIFVQADVAEEFIKDVKLNAQTTIVPIADKSKMYKGRIVKISDKAMQKNGETIIPVDIAIDNPDSFLMPDFNVDVAIDINN